LGGGREKKGEAVILRAVLPVHELAVSSFEGKGGGETKR